MPFRVETVLLAPGAEQYAGATQGSFSVASIVADARRAEAAGFDGVTVPEGGHDPFLPLVLAAEHTRRVTLGTNVAIAFPRSPMVVAQLAWDLQRLSGGRFSLGLGTQSRAHVERRYAAEWKDPAGPRLRDYVQCLRAMWASFQRGGKPEAFAGEHYRFDLLPSFSNPGPNEHPHVPIYLGILNVYGARLAGELADGIRLHPIATFRYAREIVRPAVAEGARRAGRDARAVDLVAAPFLATARDAEGVAKAKSAVKRQIAFYATNRGYQAVLAHHGWGELARDLTRLATEGRTAEMGDAISDDMLDEWAIVATWEGLAGAVRERLGGLFRSVLLELPPDLAREEQRVRDIVGALRRERD
ncbi:MAG: TIGR03617 family F420-dependent LLM class oxidoreductase [bacterium]